MHKKFIQKFGKRKNYTGMSRSKCKNNHRADLKEIACDGCGLDSAG
jgi:hypothetical protein